MAKAKITDIVGKIVALLEPLESDIRRRIIDASLTLLGDELTKPDNDDSDGDTDPAGGGETGTLPAKAKLWASQNHITLDQLNHVFHLTRESVDVIAADMPGKSAREKAVNAYVLMGISKLLLEGEPHFDDESARALCKTSGFYDHTNHTKALKDRGNKFTGSKKDGWTLTQPGLQHGAALVKGLTQPQQQ